MFSIFLGTDYPVYLIMTGLPQNIYSVINSKTLKNRLVDRGIINVKGHGYIEFSLPRFKEYVLEQISMAE